MAIFNKPFSFNEMLRRTIFLGRPNFFNAKDFNKELLIIHNFIEEFNRITAVHSTVKFTVPSFTEDYNPTTAVFTRTLNLNWTAGEILYKGVKFQIQASGVSGFSQEYNNPNVSVSPREIKPPTYIVLTAKLDTITYADNPALCGIQSDEIPNSVPTVNVEQYTDIDIVVTDDVSSLTDVICVLATIHPRYKTDGSDNGFGFLYHTFKNPELTLRNGNNNQNSVLSCNQTLFEYLLERVTLNLSEVLNERQLVRRFNLADLEETNKARHNIGLSNIVNHRQLVQAENLRDLTDPILARFHLGLGSSATKNVGYGINDVAPGNVMPTGLVAIWSGNPSSIPVGWVLCDGTNGTPNLQGKFVVGMDTGKEEFNLLGKTGGGTWVTLTEQMIPKHRHTFSGNTDNDGSHIHSQYGGNGSRGGGFDKGDDDDERFYEHPNNSNTSKHTHHFSGTTDYFGGDANDGQTQGFSILPPYYTLCYIMFKGATITPPTPPVLPPALTYPNYSVPSTATDNGYSTYNPITIGSSGGVSVGSGIILTNPE